jgi:hypothetical protein
MFVSAMRIFLGRITICRRGLILCIFARTAADGQLTCPNNWGLSLTPPEVVNEIDEDNDNKNDEDKISNEDNANISESNYLPLEAGTAVWPFVLLRSCHL